jgi:hypothetical protein
MPEPPRAAHEADPLGRARGQGHRRPRSRRDDGVHRCAHGRCRLSRRLDRLLREGRGRGARTDPSRAVSRRGRRSGSRTDARRVLPGIARHDPRRRAEGRGLARPAVVQPRPGDAHDQRAQVPRGTHGGHARLVPPVARGFQLPARLRAELEVRLRSPREPRVDPVPVVLAEGERARRLSRAPASRPDAGFVSGLGVVIAPTRSG